MGTVLECARCGATLRAEAASGGYITCEYCGAQTGIHPAPDGAGGSPEAEGAAPISFTVASPTPTPARPSRTPGGALAGREQRGAQRARRALMGVGSTLLTLALVGGGLYYGLRRGSYTHNPAQRSPVEPRVRVARGQPVCPLRVNEDDVTDFGLLMKVIQEDGETQHQVQFRDGRTGKLLGDTDPLGTLEHVRVVCLGPAHLGLQGPDHKLRIFAARKPHAGATVQLRDKLAQVAASKACARLRTADGATVGISLPEGKATACAVEPLRKPRRSPGMPTFRKTRTFTAGKTRFRIAARRRGTPVLTVVASQGRRRLWKRELDITATRFGIPALMSERTLLVVGALHPRRKRARLIGLDRATGERRFTVRLQGSSIATFGCALLENGAHAVLWSNGGVVAFDPTTGKEVWRLQ